MIIENDLPLLLSPVYIPKNVYFSSVFETFAKNQKREH